MQMLRSTMEERMAGLGRCHLFSGLLPPELRSLAGFTSVRTFEKGETLFIQEAPAEGFFIVIDGRIKVCRFGADGREQVLHIFGRGEPCGEVPTFQGESYPATAVAVGALRSLYVPRDQFAALVKRKPDIVLNMLAVVAARLRHFVGLVEDLSLKEVSARLAAYVLDLSRRSGGSLHLELETSKTVLAGRLGTIAETLSRTMAKMQERGILRVQGKRIAILDSKRLRALASGVKL
jgi:CRP/FNR family transcriptional regulator, dissimilatory nitrate respiration regulator